MSPRIRLLRYVEFSVRYLSLGSALRNDFQLNTSQYYDAGLYEEYVCALSLWQANWLDNPEVSQSNQLSRHIWESSYETPLTLSLVRRPCQTI